MQFLLTALDGNSTTNESNVAHLGGFGTFNLFQTTSVTFQASGNAIKVIVDSTKILLFCCNYAIIEGRKRNDMKNRRNVCNYLDQICHLSTKNNTMN